MIIAARDYDGDGARELIAMLPKDHRWVAPGWCARRRAACLTALRHSSLIEVDVPTGILALDECPDDLASPVSFFFLGFGLGIDREADQKFMSAFNQKYGSKALVDSDDDGDDDDDNNNNNKNNDNAVAAATAAE